MFKKIEIWILYLTILLSILFAIGFGTLVRQELVGTAKAGWVSKTALFLAELPINIKRLISSDVVVEDRFLHLDGFSGSPNIQQSYILFSRYDGDLQEGIVELINLKSFEVLHTWNPDIDAFNDLVDKVDEFKYLNRDSNNSRFLLLHPKLDENGNLLFQNASPLRKIDACSNLIFQNSHNQFHHSLETDTDGNIWIPSRMYPHSLPLKKIGKMYSDDAIVKLSPNGELLYEKSISQIFIENGLEYLLFSVGDSHSAGRGDFDTNPIHLNDIQPVNFDGKFWKKGDLFLSLRHQSMVLLYRPESNEIIWKWAGPFFHQHDVDILNDHSISVFNNNSKDFAEGDVVDGNNQVLIYNFETNNYSSYNEDSMVINEIRTITNGRSQILPNGDLLIEETDYGRTLYFNADGSLRWSHINRADNGNVYRVGWSRILYTDEDFHIVNNFLSKKDTCN
jgi:hypothetical protein